MTRFDKLQKELNKNIPVDERTNQLITAWSPNNVRRLIVGFDFAVVQYFVSGGKYHKLLEVVDFRSSAESDYTLFKTQGSSYVPILNVLTKGRVCSSVEEVIFCIPGYPSDLLASDVSPLITSGNAGGTSLANRFVRLRHLSLVELPVKNVASLAEQSKSSTALLLDQLTSKPYPHSTILSLHEDDWWRGQALRPKYYSMDAEVLSGYFDKVRTSFDQANRSAKLESISATRSLELSKKYMPAIRMAIQMIFSNLETGNKLFEKTSLIGKAEWAHPLMTKNVEHSLAHELSQQEDLLASVRGIDFEGIIALDRQQGVKVEGLLAFHNLLFTSLAPQGQYQQDSRKLSVEDSIPVLLKVVSLCFNTQINVIYLSFAKYLTRNTPKYAKEFFSRLRGLYGFQYTRSIIEYCNLFIEPGWAKTAFDSVGGSEIPSADFTVESKNIEVNRILISF